MQLFGLHYRGIMDAPDLKWFTAILDEYKLLDIKDFLHDVSPYGVTQPLPPQRAAPTNVSQSARPSIVPPRCIVESDIFESGETVRERSSDNQEDTPSWGTLFSERRRGFNQGPWRAKSQEPSSVRILVHLQRRRDPISSSQGYQSHEWTRSSACRGSQFYNKKKSRL
jgi:hypothetical protein